MGSQSIGLKGVLIVLDPGNPITYIRSYWIVQMTSCSFSQIVGKLYLTISSQSFSFQERT